MVMYKDNNGMAVFDKALANRILNEGFAPWVLDLGLSVESVSDEAVIIRMAFSDRICRMGGIISGQAMMALIDTTAVLAVIAKSGRRISLTTVDLPCHVLKPAAKVDHMASAHVLRLGRTMAFVRVEIYPDNLPENPVAAAQVACAVLPE